MSQSISQGAIDEEEQRQLGYRALILNIHTMIDIRLWSRVDLEPSVKARISLLHGSFYSQDNVYKGEEIKYKLETVPPEDQLGTGLW